MATNKRDARIYLALRALIRKPFAFILNFHSSQYDLPEGPHLVVSNHNTDVDPILIATAFRQHMYFVASEHIFRWGWISKLIVWLVQPIARVKGSTDATSALAIMRRLRSGANVCLFAEGNRSYNGVTGYIFPATGKLVKSARASLVTYRLSGAYFATPRWGRGLRRGPIKGEMVRIYSQEELKQMTADEINACIRRDLYEDAFERQLEQPHQYRGKHLAEHLEYALYLCPKCGRVGTLQSKKDRFYCDCGLSVRYNSYGFFESDADAEPTFATVRDWDRWQEEQMYSIVANAGDAAVFTDENARLISVDDGHKMQTIAEGSMSISKTHFTCADRCFALDSITDMAMCGATHITFSTSDGGYYEIRTNPPKCGRKYLMFFQTVKAQG